MASKATERTVRLSVIDRLLDQSLGTAADPPITWSESVRRLKASLLRDVEWLLNTRRTIEPAPDLYPEAQRSVYHYGLPDISSLSGDSDVARWQLKAQIEECLELFEPRLINVRVVPVEAEDKDRRQIRFVVDGLLRMDPNPERIIFDTVLETARGEFRVSGDEHA